MRARNIKPNFFKNEYLAELPYEARLLFAGLWCMADREGRLEDRPRRIKGELFPYDNIDIDDLLQKLHDTQNGEGEEIGFIVRYEVGGRKLIQITNFSEHQSPHVKEQDSNLPELSTKQASTRHAPDMHQTCTEVAALNPDTGYLIPDTGLRELPLQEEHLEKSICLPEGLRSERYKHYAQIVAFMSKMNRVKSYTDMKTDYITLEVTAKGFIEDAKYLNADWRETINQKAITPGVATEFEKARQKNGYAGGTMQKVLSYAAQTMTQRASQKRDAESRFAQPKAGTAAGGGIQSPTVSMPKGMEL